MRATGELEEPFHLSLQPGRPLRHLLFGVERALARLAARVADQAGAAADEHDGAVARQLDPPERQEGYEAPDVQAVGRRVEAAVDRAGRFRQMRVQFVHAGRVRDQAAPLEVAEYG